MHCQVRIVKFDNSQLGSFRIGRVRVRVRVTGRHFRVFCHFTECDHLPRNCVGGSDFAPKCRSSAASPPRSSFAFSAFRPLCYAMPNALLLGGYVVRLNTVAASARAVCCCKLLQFFTNTQGLLICGALRCRNVLCLRGREPRHGARETRVVRPGEDAPAPHRKRVVRLHCAGHASVF